MQATSGVILYSYQSGDCVTLLVSGETKLKSVLVIESEHDLRGLWRMEAIL
jgi:hypothetical protein